MKQLKIFDIFVLMMTILSVVCFCSNVYAVESHMSTDEARIDTANNNITGINQDEETNLISDNSNSEANLLNIHEGDLYITGNQSNYVMDQLVDGNVFIFGNNVTVKGEIKGSLFICASKIVIDKDAYVGCHLFACAQTIEIDGMVSDVYTASHTLIFGETALIGRDIRAVAENISLAGEIYRNVHLEANRVEVANSNKLKIYGDLAYEASKEIENLNNELVAGEIKFEKSEDKQVDIGKTVLDYVFSAINTVAFDVILYIVLMFFAPKFVKKSKEYISTRGFLAFAIGLVFTIIVPILTILFLMIDITVGFAGIILLVYGIVFMINSFAVVVCVNEFITNKLKISDDKMKKGLLLSGVSLAVWILRKLPFIGSFVSVIICLCGIGIVILYQFDKIKKDVKE